MKRAIHDSSRTPAGSPGRLSQSIHHFRRLMGGILQPTARSATGGEPGHSAPGSSPGIEALVADSAPPAAGQVTIQVVDYGPERIETTEVNDPGEWLRAPRPDWAMNRWINVNGLHPHVVNQVRQHYRFHTLAAEDVLRVHQRPKLEVAEDHLFIVARMLMRRDNRLHSEQVSVFLFPGTVLTFQETAGDVWDPIRQRLQKPGSRLRTHDASYLLYALLDAVVDHCFPMLEEYGEMLEDLEQQVLLDPQAGVQQRIHAVKRELAYLRRIIWPMRDVLNQLAREDTAGIAEPVRAYLRDVYDHAVQVMDLVESCREAAASLNDLYMSAISNRMNEIMKVLTLMASFFIPITFVAGVYGMNFEHIPELHWKYSYLVFWAVCAAVAGFLAVFFYRKGWMGRR